MTRIWVRVSAKSELPHQTFFLLSILLPAILADGHEHEHHDHEPISLLDNTKISFVADRRREREPLRMRQVRRKGAQAQLRRGRVEVANTLTPPFQVTIRPVALELGGDHFSFRAVEISSQQEEGTLRL